MSCISPIRVRKHSTSFAAGIEPQLIVILSDINMPVMDGLELLREIKTRRPDLPVMMVTAYGDDERRRLAVRRGRVRHQAGRLRFPEDPASRSVRRCGLTNPSAAWNGRFQTILAAT